MAIIIELQKEAIASGSDVLTLLRKALLVSKKLKLAEFERWVNFELNGYTDGNASIPDYREIKGTIQAHNPYRGWIPVVLPDIKTEEALCNWKLPDAIPTVLSLLESKDRNFRLGVNAYITAFLNQHSELQTEYRLLCSVSLLRNIVEQVKSQVLNWALVLEENGIIGEELTFTDEEKKIAHTSPQIISYTNNFYGEVKDSQIQQGTNKSKQLC